MSDSNAVCTIIAKNYLAFARVLMASVRQYHPRLKRFVVLVDHSEGYFEPENEDFVVIHAEDIQISNFKHFLFKYTIVELCTAIKPYAIDYLFHRYALDKLVYLDPDIKLYAPLDCVFLELDSHSIVLTPHLTAPLDDDRKPSELDILRSGSYNLGFAGLSNREESLRFIKWWESRVYDQCVVDVPRGLFVDQKWVDLVPGLFRDVGILRNPGLNVAYWNLAHRKISRRRRQYSVDGEPLCFFHFSGFSPNRPEELSKHQDRFCFPSLGDARFLVADYRRDLLSHGFTECSQWPYTWGHFANGLPIPDLARPAYRESPEFLTLRDPFDDEGFGHFMDLWNRPYGNGHPSRAVGITKLSYRIYRARSDVQSAMPDVFGIDRIRFLEWMASSGRVEHDLDQRFLTPVYTALKAAKKHESKPEASTDGFSDAALSGLPAPCRRLLRSVRDGELISLAAHNPEGIPEALNQLLEEEKVGLKLTRLASFVYRSRPDLLREFPDPGGRDAPRFLIWFLTYGREEFELPEIYVAPLRRQWPEVLRSLNSPIMALWYRFALFGASAVLASGVRGRALVNWYPMKRASKDVTQAQPSEEVPSPRQAGQQRLVETHGELGINLVGYFRTETGVGEAVRISARAAIAVDLGVSVTAIGTTGTHRESEYISDAYSSEPKFPVNLFHVNADQAEVVMSQMEPRFCDGRYNIGYWAWELEDFPDRWFSSFEHYNEIWVPSSFCQDAVSRKAVCPVVRVPLSVSIDDSGPADRSKFGIPAHKYAFLYMFDMYSVFERKNPIASIRAFAKAFPRTHSCVLVVKVNHADVFPTEMDKLREAAASSPVVILDRSFSRTETYELIRSCDCLVSLHRSEGFGLAMAEAMYLRKPVIATGYSGNLDFTNQNTAFLVDHRIVRVGAGCDPYPEDSFWAEPSVDHAAQLMRLVHQSPELRRRRAAAGRMMIQTRFSPHAAGVIMRRRIEQQLRRRGWAGASTSPLSPHNSWEYAQQEELDANAASGRV